MELERCVNVGKQRFDLEPSRFEPSGQPERLAEHVQLLVDCESGTIGRDLEENSPGLPEVDGFEVVAIQLGSHVVAKRRELGANLHLLCLSRRAESNVVHRSRSHHSRPDSRNAAQVDDGPWTTVAGRVPEYASLLAHEPESQSVREELPGQLIGIEPEGDGINAADRVLSGHSCSRPASVRIRAGVGDQLTHESFVILERDHALVFVARNGLVELDALLDQPLDPEANGAGQDREGRYGYLTTALPPATGIRPREKSEDASRASRLVTEVEMIGCRIVEVYGALDEPEAKNAGVEVEIPLWITGYAGDVMNTGRAKLIVPILA